MRTAFCFDVDGTLSTTEILPCIAADLDIAAEMATLTRATMDGLIPFEDSFRLRVALLSQVPTERVQEIVAAVPLDPRLLAFIQSNVHDCFLVSGNLDIWLSPISGRVGCKVYTSVATRNGGKIRVDRILNKGDAIDDLRSTAGFERIVAIGDGANDCYMFEKADVAVAYGGVHPPAAELVSKSHYVANDGGALCRLLSTL